MDFFKEYFLEFIKNNIIHIIIIVLEIIVITILIIDLNNKKIEIPVNNNSIIEEKYEVENETIANVNEDVIIDIKGAVKNPGVYKVNNKTIINDAIATAGGLTKNASTININLGAQVFDRMVIYVATKQELEKKINETTKKVLIEEKNNNDMQIVNDANIDNSKSVGIETKNNNTTIEKEEDNKEEINDLISINKASKEELMQLPSIGEAKALKIIEYREANGLFKNIEDIKNVSGIGDSLFEKIKDYIIL